MNTPKAKFLVSTLHDLIIQLSDLNQNLPEYRILEIVRKTHVLSGQLENHLLSDKGNLTRRIPIELLEQIWKFLLNNEMTRTKLVCKTWHCIWNNKELEKRLRPIKLEGKAVLSFSVDHAYSIALDGKNEQIFVLMENLIAIYNFQGKLKFINPLM